MITQYDIMRFTEGDCHYLAKALVKLDQSLQMAAFARRDYPDVHAMALRPDGKVIDVYGVQTQDEALDRWKLRPRGYSIKTFDWKALKEFSCPPEYGNRTYTRSRAVAKILLASA